MPAAAAANHAVLCCALLQLWDREGKHIRTMASLSLAEDIPIAFNSCRTGGVPPAHHPAVPCSMSHTNMQQQKHELHVGYVCMQLKLQLGHWL